MDRAHKTVLWIEKFRCQNSNLNLPTIKNGFYRFSYPQDRLRIQNRSQAQFWNPWAMQVAWRCAWIVPGRSSHGERLQNVITCSQNEPHVEMIFELNLAR